MNNKTLTVDLEPLYTILDKFADRGRDALMPLLHEAQALYGWLPREVQRVIGETLRVPLADIHGVIEFYSMFYNEPAAKRVVRLCEDPACHLAGAESIATRIEAWLTAKDDEAGSNGEIRFERVPCLGMCEQAPAVLNGEKPAGNLSQDDVVAFLNGEYAEPSAKVFGEPLWILKRLGKIDPTKLSDYEDNGGYRVLRKAVRAEPESIIEMVDQSGILGRGGAMFPVGRKWRFTRAAAGEKKNKHFVVNCDESEPGTFKDRYIMEEDPFSIVEAATIAAYAVGAENGWFFVRGEYPRAYARLANAVGQARAAGLLGRNIMGRQGFNFDIELRLGAGAYICGEETALFEAIEGRRGFPRIKPPFPVTQGLFHQPTAINNVETLAAILAAFDQGIDTWRSLGTENSPGTKLFCLSGHVKYPGVYEVPFGITIAELIERAGSVPGGRAIQAVLVGGAAGVFVKPESLNMPLTYEDSRSNNVPLGSGVIMVFDETADVRAALYQVSRFFAHESCGKCFPCQLGTQRQMEILKRIFVNHGARPDDKIALEDIGLAMSQTSLCGLGQTAATAVLSAIDLWPETFE